MPLRLGKLINKTQTTHNCITGTTDTVGAQRLSKKKKLLQLVDLDLNPANKHAGIVPVTLGKFNTTVINV